MKRRFEPAVDRLLTRKEALERLISDELKRPRPDWLHLRSLKRTRLDLKDCMTRLMKARSKEAVGA